MERTRYASTDALIWQLFATVLIPGITLRCVYAASNSTLRMFAMPYYPRRYISSVARLSAIPFIVAPIDYFVTNLMDVTIRDIYSRKREP